MKLIFFPTRRQEDRKAGRNRFLALCLCVFVFNNITAQAQDYEQYYNEFYVQGGVGSSALRYTFEDGDVGALAGGNIGVGYKYFFSRNFGFTTGIEASFYNTSLKRDAFQESFPIGIQTGVPGDFTLRAVYSGFEEKQRAVYMQIPLMLDVQAPLSPSVGFFLSAGGKIAMPASASASQTVESLTTTGYSSYTDLIYENLPQHGFDTYRDMSSKPKLQLKTTFIAAAETGLKWIVSDKNALYTGLYIDYGLSNILKPSSATTLLEYNEASPPDYVFNSPANTGAIKSMRPFGVGLRLRLSFGFGDRISNAFRDPGVL